MLKEHNDAICVAESDLRTYLSHALQGMQQHVLRQNVYRTTPRETNRKKEENITNENGPTKYQKSDQMLR